MKRTILILVICVFSFLYYMGFLTQKETLPFSEDFFSIEGPSATERLWELKKISVGNKAELDQLYQLKLDKGIRNLPVLSYFLIREAEQARKKKDFKLSAEFASASIRFSPDLPQPYFELARTLWHQNHFQLDNILSAFFKGQIARFHHYPSLLSLSYEIFYLLSNAILLTFMVFGIVLVIKYLPLYFYDIRKHFTHEISAWLAHGLKIFFLLIPILLGLDMLWFILFWSLLLWGYVTKREKQLLTVFLIVLVYLPFFLHSSYSFLEGPSLDITWRMYQANHEDWDRTTIDKLQAWLLNHPNDTEVIFTLGLIEKRQGRYPQAEAFYEKAIQQDPKLSEALSNLGNVYLAQKKIPLAIASYQQAIDLNPNQGAYYYNLYRAYSQESLLSGKTDQVIQRARQLAPLLVDYYSEIDSPQVNRQAIDEILTTEKLWRRFPTQFIVKEGWLFWVFNGWFEKIPSRTPLLVPVVFLGFLIGMSRYGQTKRFLRRCPICGIPTYRLYSGTSEKEILCFNCYRIFMQKEKLHPKVTEKKSLQAEQLQRETQFIVRFLSLFLVGFGYVWREHFLKGLIFLFLFFILILRFVYWNGVIPSSFPQTSPNLWRVIFWEGIFLVLYLFSLRQTYRLKPRFEIEEGSLPSTTGEKELKV